MTLTGRRWTATASRENTPVSSTARDALRLRRLAPSTTETGTRVTATTIATSTTTPARPIARPHDLASKRSRPDKGDRHGDAREEDGAAGGRHGPLSGEDSLLACRGATGRDRGQLLAEPG